MTLEFGIFDHLDRPGPDLAAHYADRLALVAAADAAGFYGYHVAEHHGTPIGMAPSPGVWLSAVAARTTRLRFGPLVYLLPFYNPLRLVEEICMLDNLSGGRFQLGVGRGVSPFEGGFFGIDNAESPYRFAEALEAVLKGLTSERLVHRGEFYKINNVPMELKPHQKPHPPLWYGLGSERSVGLPARHGMNVVMLGPTDRLGRVAARYRAAWDEHAGAPERADCPVKTAAGRRVAPCGDRRDRGRGGAPGARGLCPLVRQPHAAFDGIRLPPAHLDRGLRRGETGRGAGLRHAGPGACRA